MRLWRGEGAAAVPRMTTRTIFALVLSGIALLAASAKETRADTAGLVCGGNPTHPFLPWVDPAAYVLMPKGSVESTSGWTLKGGAKLVSGNEPYYVNSANDKMSLALPPGSSATTAPMCIGLLDPTMRFFARNTGSPLSTLKVDVLYTTKSGRQRSLTVLPHVATSAWLPTLPVPFLANVTNVLSLDGLTTDVAFRFTPQDGLLGKGNWRIDDLYVDPWLSE